MKKPSFIQLDTSDLYIMDVPEPLPEPFNKWASTWKKWLKTNNGELIIVRRSRCHSGVDGFTVDRLGIPGFLPEKWISYADRKNTNNCDCSSRDLFNKGCPGHDA